jgi:cold shock CspA family protein
MQEARIRALHEAAIDKTRPSAVAEKRPPLNQLRRCEMAIGTIKLFDQQNGCGCIQSDGDRGNVLFFHRLCVAPGYAPRKGDRVAFSVRANPRSGRPEAFQIASQARTAA